MITYVNNIREWSRWNDLIFRDQKDTIVLSISKSDPRFRQIVRELNTFKKTLVFCLQPRDFREIMKLGDQPYKAPCIIGYQSGEQIFSWSSEPMKRDEEVDTFTMDDIMFELGKHFI